MLDASEDAAPEAIAVLTLERHARIWRSRGGSGSSRRRSAPTSAASRPSSPRRRRGRGARNPTIEHQRSARAGDSWDRGAHRGGADRGAHRSFGFGADGPRIRRRRGGSSRSGRASTRCAPTSTRAREAGDTTGFDETFRSIVRVRKSKDLLDLRDETPQLRDMASRERGGRGGAARRDPAPGGPRDRSRPLRGGGRRGAEASRASLVSRYDAAQAALIDAT